MKILVADGDAGSRYNLSNMVRQIGHEVVLASNGTEALTILHNDSTPSIAILDSLLPDIEAIELSKQIRAIRDGHYTYLISVSPADKMQALVEATEAGFDDVLSKPVEMKELQARLIVGNRLIEAREKLLLTFQTVKCEASHDDLTGVWNRAEIMQFLCAQLARDQRSGTIVAALMIDVDRFKAINDNYGHRAGDCVLKHLASLMTSSIRPYDWLGRYGDDEFLLVAPDCSAEAACALAERLCRAIAGKPVTVDGHQLTVTVSMGLATSREIGVDVTELLDSTDAALYVAKQKGRNRVESHYKLATDKPRDRRGRDLHEGLPAESYLRTPAEVQKQ